MWYINSRTLYAKLVLGEERIHLLFSVFYTDESSWKLSVPESITEISTLRPCDTAVFDKVIPLAGNGI